MIGAHFSWVSGERFVADMIARSRQVTSAVIEPWKRDVQRRITRMYVQGGKLHGEQARWLPNRPATIRRKGHARVLIGGRGSAMFQFGRMNRSYVIESQPRGGMRWRMVMTNRARSRTGYDYPSLHHRGGNRVPARPHLQFYPRDVRALNRRMGRFVLEGKRDAGLLDLG